ncbi:MAG: hypothetical protein PHF00_12220 [Elusimicrobia bacterium]|nr:hypothetical protein [Elusimicrobiota bacterium]
MEAESKCRDLDVILSGSAQLGLHSDVFISLLAKDGEERHVIGLRDEGGKLLREADLQGLLAFMVGQGCTVPPVSSFQRGQRVLFPEKDMSCLRKAAALLLLRPHGGEQVYAALSGLKKDALGFLKQCPEIILGGL